MKDRRFMTEKAVDTSTGTPGSTRVAHRTARVLTFGIGLAVAVVVGGASVAMATVPDASQCTIPTVLEVGGVTNTGLTDTSSAYRVVIRDALGVPVASAEVRIELGNCVIPLATNDLFLVRAAVFPGHPAGPLSVPPGSQLCPFTVVTGTTDALGRLTVYVEGAGNNQGLAVPPAVANGKSTPGCAAIFANGISMGSATVCIFDLNGRVGSPGVTGLELAVLKNDIGAFGLVGLPAYRARSDYNGSTSVNGLDFSLLKDVVGCSNLGGCSNSGVPGTYCP